MLLDLPIVQSFSQFKFLLLFSWFYSEVITFVFLHYSIVSLKSFKSVITAITV